MILFQVYMLNQALHGYYTDVNWQPLYTGIIINNHRIAISLQNQTKQNQRQEICPLSNSLKNNSRNGFFFSKPLPVLILGKLKTISSFF